MSTARPVCWRSSCSADRLQTKFSLFNYVPRRTYALLYLKHTVILYYLSAIFSLYNTTAAAKRDSVRNVMFTTPPMTELPSCASCRISSIFPFDDLEISGLEISSIADHPKRTRPVHLAPVVGERNDRVIEARSTSGNRVLLVLVFSTHLVKFCADNGLKGLHCGNVVIRHR